MNNEFEQQTRETFDGHNHSNKAISCKKLKEENIDSEMLSSSQTSNLCNSVRRKFNFEANPSQRNRKASDRSKIRDRKKFQQPLITIPKFASISKLEFNQFSLPRDYRALKLEARRESIVYSNIDNSATEDKAMTYLDGADKQDDNLAEQKLKRRNILYSGLEKTKCKGETYDEYDSLSFQITPQDGSKEREIDFEDRQVNMTSEDIFDIDDEEFVTRIDINHIAGQKVLPVLNDDSSSITLRDTYNNHDILSQESTIIMNEPSDSNISEIKLKDSSQEQTLSVTPIKSEQYKTKSHTSSLTLLEYPCKIDKLFNLYELKYPKRILFNFLENKNCLVSVVLEEEVIFYLQNATNWIVLGKLQRYLDEKHKSNIIDCMVLLSSYCGASNYRACLKSFVISEENTVNFTRDYSYYCFFNNETNNYTELSSSEDEICGER